MTCRLACSLIARDCDVHAGKLVCGPLDPRSPLLCYSASQLTRHHRHHHPQIPTRRAIGWTSRSCLEGTARQGMVLDTDFVVHAAAGTCGGVVGVYVMDDAPAFFETQPSPPDRSNELTTKQLRWGAPRHASRALADAQLFGCVWCRMVLRMLDRLTRWLIHPSDRKSVFNPHGHHFHRRAGLRPHHRANAGIFGSLQGGHCEFFGPAAQQRHRLRLLRLDARLAVPHISLYRRCWRSGSCRWIGQRRRRRRLLARLPGWVLGGLPANPSIGPF